MDPKEIKSWQIALIGFLLFLIGTIILAFFVPCRGGCDMLAQTFIIVPVYLIFLMLPVLFLRANNNKAKIIGAILSILWGLKELPYILHVIALGGITDLFGESILTITSIIILTIITPILYLSAGIYYFWKKT